MYYIMYLSSQVAGDILHRTPQEIVAMKESDPDIWDCLLFSHTGLRKRMQFKSRHQGDEQRCALSAA